MPFTAFRVFWINIPAFMIKGVCHSTISVYVMETDAGNMTAVATNYWLQRTAIAVRGFPPAGLADDGKIFVNRFTRLQSRN